MGGFTEALKRFGIGRLAAILGVAAGVAAVLVAVMLRVGQAPDALLYSNLDLREASEISAALDQAGIKYSSKGDGSTIFVSRDEVGTARLMQVDERTVYPRPRRCTTPRRCATRCACWSWAGRP